MVPRKIRGFTLERNIDYSISNKTILIVEDEELVRTMSKKLVESLGYRVITANDGLEGVDIYKQNHSEIDAVLLDMKMPRMGGKEAFIEMQKINPDIKVLLSTGYGNNEEAQDLIDLGVKDLLTKPYQIDDLSDMLSEII